MRHLNPQYLIKQAYFKGYYLQLSLNGVVGIHYHGNHFSLMLIALKGGHIQGSLLIPMYITSAVWVRG